MDSGKRKLAKSAKSVNKHAEELRHSITLMRRVLLGFKGRLDDELRPRNVTTSQLRFLTEVKERPGASGAQMARACYVTPQSAQAMMVRAVERGWVVRGTDNENHRLVTARLTPAGERLLTYADSVMARMELEVWDGVPVSEFRAMNKVLERGLANLED
jgi:DNA-binding MarR family transcriptional regulator